MKRKSVNILITLGLLLILAALSLSGYNLWDNMKASIKASDALAQLEFGSGSREWENSPDMEMLEVQVDGIWYVGAIEIPALDKQLPVASYWDEKYAKTAPCRYSGSPYTKDMIIAGHNYGQHFGQIRKLVPGDEVYFTDMYGNTFKYAVVSLEEIDGYDVESMKSENLDTAGWDLTLFTCTFGGRARIAVRCVELN